MSRKKKPSQQKQPVKAKTSASAKSPSGNASPGIPSGGGTKISLLRIAQLMFTVAFSISVYLAYTSMSAGPLAGCGTDSNCDDVLTSRWAYWFKLPVSVPAAGFYLLVLTASFFASPNRSTLHQRRAWTVLIAGAFVVFGAALWFLGLQALIIGSWCKYCMTAHAFGAAGGVLLLVAAPFVIRHRNEQPSLFGVTQRAWPALLGMVALLPLVVGQYLSTPPTSSVVKLQGATTEVAAQNSPTETEQSDLSPVEKSRLFSLHGGKYQFDLYNVPLLGNPEAPHVMVSLFDYTCSHCRNTHEKLLRVQNLYSNELAIVLMPMPLDSSCNRLLTDTKPDHVNACQYARTALALFKVKEEVFHDFENWFFETPRPRPLAEVQKKASEWSGQADFSSVVSDPGVEAWIQLGIQVFKENYSKTKKGILPMIMVGSAVMAGEIKSDEELINILVENMGIKRLPSVPGAAAIEH